uniref:Transposase (Putative), gypsy type n=1 Tax=Tanacetum cinerariifolium TaxID=118510 RepID=A0A6L2LCM2_TANCI|nr:transposase (putative), gypsy type [Tanacetum cinerariifolium]
MSAITDVKCVLTQKALDALCNKFHISEKVLPVLPNQNDTMHEKPAGKIELYTRFPTLKFCAVFMGSYQLLEIDIFSFIHTPDPTKVKIVERERNEGELLLLETTIGRIVAPDRAESELDASVERLFDEGDTVVEDVAPMQPKRQGKRKCMIVDAGGASHPSKKLKEDHGTSSGTSVSGKSRSALKRLLAGVVLNAEVEVAAMPTLPFMTTSISSTPKREGGDHTDSAAGPNLYVIRAPSRFVISSDSSHYSGTNVAEAKVDSLVRSSVSIMTTVTTITSTVDPALVSKKKLVKPSLFCVDSSSAGGTDPTTGVFSNLTGSDFLVGDIRTMVDEFAPPKFFASVRGMEHDQLFTEFNVRAARQMSLSAEVRMHVEYNVKEKRRLKSVAERKVELLKVGEGEIENFKAQLLLREAEATEAIRLRAQASNFEVVEKSFRDEMNALKERNTILEKERNALDVKVTKLKASAVGKEHELTDLNALITFVHELDISSSGLQEKVTVYENCMDQLEKFQDNRMKVVNDKFNKLYTDFVEMALHLEEKFYPHLLTIVSGRRWLLTHGMKLAIVKCLNSPEYLSALGVAIGKAIEKGMQDGLSIGIVHGNEGRVLTDVAAHNPSAKVDYTSALQQLRNVNFSLLADLKSNKDASVETVIDILLLEGPLAENLGLNELQPNVDQLMVLIHRSPDKGNIANQISALRDVFVPLAEPFSATVLTGTEGTSDTAPATANTNTALSITFASASSIASIFVDDYKVVGTEHQAVFDENDASFPNVDDAELNIPQ